MSNLSLQASQDLARARRVWPLPASPTCPLSLGEAHQGLSCQTQPGTPAGPTAGGRELLGLPGISGLGN